MAASVLLLLSMGRSMGFSQAGTPVDIRTYTYTVVVPNVVLQEGESVEIQVKVGKPGADIRGVLGFDLSFELSPLAAKLTTLDPSMNNSWVSQSGVWVQEVRTGPLGQIYTYTYGRASKVDGTGEVLRLRLVAARNGVNAVDLLQASGGILVVDNLDMRQAAPEAHQGMEVWPNPGFGSFHLRIHGETPETVQVLDLQGRLIQQLANVNEVDLTANAPGIYFLQATDSQRQVYRSRIEKI